jgi:hypothetical protein
MHAKGSVIDQVNGGLHIKKKTKVSTICDNFPHSITRTPTYGLWEHATIVCFCQSVKQLAAPLERFKCLDHG